MRLEVGRNTLKIIPETPEDEAYIEDTLGLRKKGDTIALRRIACINLDFTIAYLEARSSEPQET